ELPAGLHRPELCRQRMRCPGHRRDAAVLGEQRAGEDHTGLIADHYCANLDGAWLAASWPQGSTGTQSFCGRTELTKFGKQSVSIRTRSWSLWPMLTKGGTSAWASSAIGSGGG